MDLTRIPVRLIQAGGLEFDESLKADSFGFGEQDPRPAGQVRLAGNVESAGEEIVAHVTMEGRISHECSRCLKSFEETVHHRWMLAPEISPANTVNVLELVREELILNQPISARCRPDCRGLCAECGCDLNRGPCECVSQPKAAKG